jgi:excisionase family DNA binding protein
MPSFSPARGIRFNMNLIAMLRHKRNAWTVEELADLLQCSTKLLYKQVRSGKLRAYRIGTLIRLESDAIQEWLVKRETK